MNINYSIIIPHHNIPQLLDRCLYSIPRRDDVQIIVVDDASSEEYLPSLEKVCAKYESVELVLLNPNKGGGGARNEGLMRAKGDYVLFADADDYFNFCINGILDEYKNMADDIVFFKASCCDSYTYEPGERTNHLNRYIDLWNNRRDIAEEHLRYMFGEPWCKLIRRSLIEDNNIRFDEVRINNDTTFSYLVGHHARSVSVDSRYLYCYTTRQGSVSVQNDSWRLFVKADVFGRSSLFFESLNLNVKEDRHLKVLYTFIRNKDYEGFHRAYNQLIGLGHMEKNIKKNYAQVVARNSIKSAIWCVFYTPDKLMRLLCLKDLFTISIPRFIKYDILKTKNNEIKRY